MLEIEYEEEYVDYRYLWRKLEQTEIVTKLQELDKKADKVIKLCENR